MARGQLQVGMGITDFGGGDPSVGKVGEYRTPLQRVVDDIARSHAARLRAVPTSLQHGIEKFSGHDEACSVTISGCPSRCPPPSAGWFRSFRR
jgi:hypothetical protein